MRKRLHQAVASRSQGVSSFEPKCGHRKLPYQTSAATGDPSARGTASLLLPLEKKAGATRVVVQGPAQPGTQSRVPRLPSRLQGLWRL